MITPAQIKAKAEKIYPKVVCKILQGESAPFPMDLPADKKLQGKSITELRAQVLPLYEQQKEKRGRGFSIEWRTAQVLGIKQQVPARIYFETLEDFLYAAGKAADYKTTIAVCRQLVAAFPQLADWAVSAQKLLLQYQHVWPRIITVCNYFVAHPPPHSFYLRELPVPVHTKFIEAHASIIKVLLDKLLPADWINEEAASLPERFGLKLPPVLLRMRVLDEALIPELGYEECALPLETAAALNWQPQKVFIVENQSCYLSFPRVAGGVAIWGEGFKARLVRHLPWLAGTQLFAWLDLDAAGFEMLHMLRRHYGQVQSLFMDRATLEAFAAFVVADEKATLKRLDLLTEEERAVYEGLAGGKRRLEQERVSQGWVEAGFTNIPSSSL